MSAKDIRRTFGKGEPYFPDSYSSYYIASEWGYQLDYDTSPGDVTVWYPTFYSYDGITWYQGAWIMGRQQSQSYEDYIYGVTVLNGNLHVFYTSTVKSFSLSSIRSGSSKKLTGTSANSKFLGSRDFMLYNINEKQLYYYDTNSSYDVYYYNGSTSKIITSDGFQVASTMDHNLRVRMDWMYKNKQVVLSRHGMKYDSDYETYSKHWSIFDLNGNEVESYSQNLGGIYNSVSTLVYDKNDVPCIVSLCQESSSRYSSNIIFIYDIYGNKIVSKYMNEFSYDGYANTVNIFSDSYNLYVSGQIGTGQYYNPIISTYRLTDLSKYDFINNFSSSNITYSSVTGITSPSIKLQDGTMFGYEFGYKFNTKNVTEGTTDTTGLDLMLNASQSFPDRKNITGKL